jgi:hypothetical protein
MFVVKVAMKIPAYRQAGTKGFWISLTLEWMNLFL